MAIMADLAPLNEELESTVTEPTLPIITLGSIFVTDTTVSLCGSVSPELAQTGELRVNGYPVPITFGGCFAAVVRLEGGFGVEIALETPVGERYVLRLPMARV